MLGKIIRFLKTPKHWLAWIMMFIFIVALFFAWREIDQWGRRQFLFDKKSEVMRHVHLRGDFLSKALNRRFALLKGLYAFTALHCDTENIAKQFNSFAAGLYAGTDGIRCLALAPQGIIKYVYPKTVNKIRLNQNIVLDQKREISQDVVNAINSDETIVSDSYISQRTKNVLVVIRPIFVEKTILWGFMVLIIDLKPILSEAGISADSLNELSITLRDRDGKLVFGEQRIYESEPFKREVEMPGETWELAGAPIDGWDFSIQNEMFIFRGITSICALLLISIVYVAITWESRLREEVKARTKNVHLMIDNFKFERKNRESTEQIVIEKEEYLKTLYSADNVAFITTDLGGNDARILDFSPGAEKLLGYKKENIINNKVNTIIPKNKCAEFVQFQNSLKANTEGGFSGETVLTAESGEKIPVMVSIYPRRNAKGEIIGTVSAVIDISELKKVENELIKHRENLEEQIAERTSELAQRVSEEEHLNNAMLNLMEDLQASNQILKSTKNELVVANKELESFAYSVSHDLRAPLRSIDGFSRTLQEDHGNDLSENGRNCLSRIRAATERMETLIEELLTLSKISRHELHRDTVDLGKIAKEIISSLKEQDPKRNIAVEIQDEITGQCDLRLIRQAISNLFANAWKFTKNKEHAKIEFGTLKDLVTIERIFKDLEETSSKNNDSQDKQTVYFIKDNGAGFDMKYADKLFGAFQRLHKEEEFEGTGIGLATVQRIINKHGGRITAVAEPDKGACFYFTLGEWQ